MSTVTTNHARRNRVVAEAVVSAYIHEIAQPSRPPRGYHDAIESHTALAGRAPARRTGGAPARHSPRGPLPLSRPWDHEHELAA